MTAYNPPVLLLAVGVILKMGVVRGQDIASSLAEMSYTKSGPLSQDYGTTVVEDNGSTNTTISVAEVSAEVSSSPESEIYPSLESSEPEEGLTTASQQQGHPGHIHTPTTRRRCDGHIMVTCNITNHERCFLDEGQPRCMCLSGYEKDKHERCIAVQYYKVVLPTFLTYTADLDHKEGDHYRNVVSRAQDAIEEALQTTRLSSVYLYIEITSLVRSEGDDVTIMFDIVMPSSYAPKAYVINSDIKHGIRQVLTPSDTVGFTIAKSGIRLLQRHLENITVTATEPCSSSRYNYCDVRADCRATYPMGFICSCRSGYQDVSPDTRSNPGEICKPSSCRCLNGGECDVNHLSHTVCRCRSWYLGRNCAIDGKVLFIALNAVIGGLIILALIVCCVCLKKIQQNENRWSHLPESSHRTDRWSHHSESNYRLNGKQNMAYEEPPGHHELASLRRSDQFLSIPRPQLRSATSEQATDRSSQDQYKEHWAWTIQ